MASVLGKFMVVSETKSMSFSLKEPSVKVNATLACQSFLSPAENFRKNKQQRIHVNAHGLLYKQRVYLGKGREGRVFFQTPNAE